jgi:hypothetical protein
MTGKPRSTAARIRVALLLGVLIIVVTYAVHDVLERRARTEWKRTLNVALVVVQAGPVSPTALAALSARGPALEAKLKSEFRRYRPDADAPFAFVCFGPVEQRRAPPGDVEPGLLGLARHALELFRFTHDIDSRAGVPTRGFDARLYLVARPPASNIRQFIEGKSENGGRVGLALVELDDSMVDLALFVAAHELLHTLGATDKYDATGNTRIPDGLAEPERGYPQQYAEIMAENRPVDAQHEVPPTSLEELRVGAVTAGEIGWLGGR